MTNPLAYKKMIKKRIKVAAFNFLKSRQSKHSKVKDIQYSSLEIQKYMTCPTFSNEEVNMLHGLRSRSTECKANYKQKYIHTNILCSLCEEEDEDQQHLLKCKVLLNKLRTTEVTEGGLEYEDIFSKNVKKQKVITALYITLFKIRKDLLENQHSQRALSTTNMELRMSSDFHLCIDRLFSGI